MVLAPGALPIYEDLESGQTRLSELDERHSEAVVDAGLMQLMRAGKVRVIPIGDHVNVSLVDADENEHGD